MICPQCGRVNDDRELICPDCGQVLQTSGAQARLTGVQAIRQGKRAREEALRKPAENRRRRGGASHARVQMPAIQDTRVPENLRNLSEPLSEADAEQGAPEQGEEAPPAFERGYRPVYDESGIQAEQARSFAAAHDHAKAHRMRMINWMRVGFLSVLGVVLLSVGLWVFLNNTDAGQRMLVRLGREANSAALWAVGDEQLDEGDVEGAIVSFEKAKAQDEAEGIVDVDGLLLLGNAYEAAGRVSDAEALYEQIYTETPSRTEAYVNHIRILQASGQPGDLARAGELMKLAYEKTGESSFMTQRSDLIPAPPEVEPIAGFYEQKRYITISSYQGFDVYYTFDENAELPSGGTLVTDRILLDEGIHNLRAVAVNGELVSDELHGTYKIIMPSPQQPRSNLAPNTYKSRQKVKLRPGKDNENDDDIVIYYTVDGSSPDADSPIYHGEAFWLPTGRVVLKAVAVNKYNKVSNILEVKYKIEAKPYPLTAWTAEETISDLRLNQTTMAEFQQTYGEGNLLGEIQMEGFEEECRKYEYDWGYAVMTRNRNAWVLAELYLTDSTLFSLPRGTAIGDTEDYVVGKFRDMGQVESASGNRGLYATDDGDGKIWVQADETKIIRYRCSTADSRYWQLEYRLDRGGTVRAVDLLLIP